MRVPPHPDKGAITLSGILNALADPARLEIVAKLAEGSEKCDEIGQELDLHKSTLSHHYKVLREAGVTQTTIEGRSRMVRLRTEDLEELFPGLLQSIIASLRREKVSASDYNSQC